MSSALLAALSRMTITPVAMGIGSLAVTANLANIPSGRFMSSDPNSM